MTGSLVSALQSLRSEVEGDERVVRGNLCRNSSGEAALARPWAHYSRASTRSIGDKARRLDRLRVLRTQARNGNQTVFRIVTESVLEGRQLRFTYQARSTQPARVVSPQRLAHPAIPLPLPRHKQVDWRANGHRQLGIGRKRCTMSH